MKLNKRSAALVLSATMMLSLFGCSKPEEPSKVEETIEEVNTGSVLATKLTDSSSNEKVNRSSKIQLHQSSAGVKLDSKVDTQFSDVSYVMIYNPYIFNENNMFSDALSTGDVGSQIITSTNRAGGLDDGLDLPPVYSTADINSEVGLDDATRGEGNRAGLDPVYQVGDEHEFYVSPDLYNSSRALKEFECVYAGDNCYIWSYDGSISDSDAKKVAQEFDSQIYPKDTKTFGTARFTDNGGKVNLLFHPFTMDGLLGYFSYMDIFAESEVTADEMEAYHLNTDHAIININSLMLKDYYTTVCSTVAHEFQHLICASDCFYYYETPAMQTWLNEAMSAYAEEINYPGIKEEGYYNELMYLSDNFRTGQSLYNFSTKDDEYIGAYGAVYLFSQYVSTLGGDDVFSNIHTYWRTAFSANTNEPDSLITAMPTSIVKQINDSYTYSADIKKGFNNEEEEWLSKLTLDFYLETLSMDLANLSGLEKEAHIAMLYTQVNPVDIEGGGRIVVALNGSEFNVPSDADNGLVYIGLDKDFKVVTPIMSSK